MRNTPPHSVILTGMSQTTTPDPFTDLLRATPIGAALFLAAEARTRMREAATLTRDILNLILQTLIIPAEALARRVILALAASLHAPLPRPPRAPSAPAEKQSKARPDAPGYGNLKPPFRMLEALPGARPRGVPKPVRMPTKDKAAPTTSSDERFLISVFRRLNSVIDALNDPEAEAIRFLRRRPALAAEGRIPLAFGHPPGLKAAAPDPALAGCLARSDRDAQAAWSALADTS